MLLLFSSKIYFGLPRNCYQQLVTRGVSSQKYSQGMCTVTESYFTKFLLVTNLFIIWSLKVFQYLILFNLAIHNSSFQMLCNVLFPRRGGWGGGGGRLEGLDRKWAIAFHDMFFAT